MTPHEFGNLQGCQAEVVGDCSGQLTDDDFILGGKNHQVVQLLLTGCILNVASGNVIGSNAVGSLTLIVDGKRFLLSKAVASNFQPSPSGAAILWVDVGLSPANSRPVQAKLLTEQPCPVMGGDLPRDPGVQPVRASERMPENGRASDAFRYVGVGNGTTTIIRYADGRMGEAATPHVVVRTMFECD